MRTVSSPVTPEQSTAAPESPPELALPKATASKTLTALINTNITNYAVKNLLALTGSCSGSAQAAANPRSLPCTFTPPRALPNPLMTNALLFGQRLMRPSIHHIDKHHVTTNDCRSVSKTEGNNPDLVRGLVQIHLHNKTR